MFKNEISKRLDQLETKLSN